MTREEALTILDARASHAVFVVVNGSEAHGTALQESSDFDLLGMAVPPLDHFLGLRTYGSKGTKEVREGDLDAVVYDVRKLVQLLSNQNPNVTMMLHVADRDVLRCTPAAEHLRESRNLFLTSKVATTFMGYAVSALKKMGAPDGPTGDMGAKRKASVEQFGFDTKDASHLVRLLRMGEEILLTGQVSVDRSEIDAEELKAIKRGEWSLERVKAEADLGFERVKAAEAVTKLPHEVDSKAVNELCVRVVRESLGL